mgnify:FL=1
MTNDAASVEVNYLTQQLSLITKAVTFFGAFIMMLFYSPLMTAIAAALTVLPFIAGAYFALNGYGLTPGAVILFVNLMNFTIEPIASLPRLLAGRKAANALRIEDFCSCISFFAANFFHRRCIFRHSAKS